MIAPGSSRYISNDMVHNHYLEEAKKKTQESGRNSEPSVMPSARSQFRTRIHDHSNELSRSKLVPKVFLPAYKQLQSLQKSGITISPSHNNAELLTRVLRIILVILPEHPSDTVCTQLRMEILLDHIKQALGRSYALSWKPCQGDSLNLPDHRIHKDGDGDASFQLKSDSLPHAHAQTTKTFYKHQD
ncbi:hypothetical protein Tco_0111895 [Tanacetum coccineum]